MNVLITGGAGYIGSICAETLVACGASVIVLDDLRAGHREAIPSQATFCNVDLAEHVRVDQVFANHKIDAVMHFAAEALVSKSMCEPSAFYACNVACGINLLDSMMRHTVRKLIFSSTCAVYGEPDTVPITEDCPKNPINPYGKSKLIFEDILEDYRKYAGLEYVSLRYFNAAGASEERGEAHREETHLIPNVLDAAFDKTTHVDVFGSDYPTSDGTCIRDYIHVLDIAEAHLLALEAIDRVAGEAFNIGTGRGYSIREVIKTARRITGCPIREKISLRRVGDPAVLVASGEKMRNRLGWTPKHSTLDEIISSAWVWKNKHPDGYQ